MKNTVLLEALSPIDKTKIESYIDKYGVIKDNFVGVNKWLQFWSYSKQKLFKLLGNKLIHKIDINYQKEYDTIKSEINKLLHQHPFIESYNNFYYSIIMKYYEEKIIDLNTKNAFDVLASSTILTSNFFDHSIKMRKPGSKKMLQIQKGAKPIRAFSKIISYFKDEFQFKDFEDFRIKHSMILNDKNLKGKLCISIHPLDFITMSDNANDWSSCMSWKDSGCYHLGTVEMMNSNNVLCCYIESEDPLLWEDRNTKVIHEWNSKKFRVLTYVTKDIIVNGKSYPFQNVNIVKIIIDVIRDLAEKNLGWTYSFGPERYKDMIHINHASDIIRNKQWIKYGDTIKHNIIFDTNAMYNDMFNDNNKEYWCYRNKVKKNKVINLSGKANCLCCNEDVKELSYEEYDYNDRFSNPGSVICYDCLEKNRCDCCYDYSFTLKTYEVFFKHSNGVIMKKKICQRCWDRSVKICPDCGKPYIMEQKSYLNNETIKKYGEIIINQDFSEEKEYYLRSENGYIFKTREELISQCYSDIKHNSKNGILPVENLILHNCNACQEYLSNIKEIQVVVSSPWNRDYKNISMLPRKIVEKKYGFHILKTPEWYPNFTFEIN